MQAWGPSTDVAGTWVWANFACYSRLPPMSEPVMKVIKDVLLPLITADGGELYVVHAADDEVQLHLAGRFAGCPGNTLATRRVIEPLIHKAAPNARVSVTSGAIIPKNARRL